VNWGVIPHKADPAKRGTVFHPPNELHVSHDHDILSCNAIDSTRWLTVRGKGRICVEMQLKSENRGYSHLQHDHHAGGR
jgi:hypothetical protein